MLQNFRTGEKAPAAKGGIPYDPSAVLSLEDIMALDKQYLLGNYSRMPAAFRYGSGEFLYDVDGKEYIDFLSGIAVNSVGHAHADLVERLISQADMLWHTSNLFYNQQQAMLARALVEISFPGKVFFCNSGTEANEAAFKLVRAYGLQKGGKTRIISLYNSFHGRTFGAMSLTGQAKVHDGFGNLADEIVFIEANDIDQLEAAFDDKVAGIFLEPIQGEGGVLPMTPAFMTRCRELCTEFSALMVLDEIQTGIGRTGKYFAWQHYGIRPDVITMAKGLGGGFPIGAMLVADEYADVLASGAHGSTFGGNHLATAIGYEVLRLIESQQLLDNAAKLGDLLVRELKSMQRKYSFVKDVRGMGLLIGIVLDEKMEARPLVSKGLEKQIVIGRAGHNVIRLAPPLILREITAEKALERLESIFREI